MKQSMLCIVIAVCFACSTSMQGRSPTQAKKELDTMAHQLLGAILDRDVETILKVTAPPRRVWNYIELGEDYKIPIEEYVRQMREQKGEAYARLFDTPQWQMIIGPGQMGKKGGGWLTAADHLCLRDRLLTVEKAVTIRVEVQLASPGVPMYGDVIFDWPGKEEVEFGYLQGPTFVYTKYGWRVWTFFGHD